MTVTVVLTTDLQERSSECCPAVIHGCAGRAGQPPALCASLNTIPFNPCISLNLDERAGQDATCPVHNLRPRGVWHANLLYPTRAVSSPRHAPEIPAVTEQAEQEGDLPHVQRGHPAGGQMAPLASVAGAAHRPPARPRAAGPCSRSGGAPGDCLLAPCSSVQHHLDPIWQGTRSHANSQDDTRM